MTEAEVADLKSITEILTLKQTIAALRVAGTAAVDKLEETRAQLAEASAQLRELQAAARALVDACNLTTCVEPPDVDRAIDGAMDDVEDALAIKEPAP